MQKINGNIDLHFLNKRSRASSQISLWPDAAVDQGNEWQWWRSWQGRGEHLFQARMFTQVITHRWTALGCPWEPLSANYYMRFCHVLLTTVPQSLKSLTGRKQGSNLLLSPGRGLKLTLCVCALKSSDTSQNGNSAWYQTSYWWAWTSGHSLWTLLKPSSQGLWGCAYA